jgi:Methyltransferase domain
MAGDDLAAASTPGKEIVEFDKIRASCPLCGSTDLSREFGLNFCETDLSWDRCGACSLVFQNPQLSPAGLRTLYRASSYFGGNRLSAYEDYTKHDAVRIVQSHRRLDLIRSRAGISGGALLDIGSASGFFGYAAKQRGFDVTCVEPDESMCAFGRSSYGLDMRADTLETFDAKGRLFDVVTLWGTDSHFANPLEGFRKISSMLKSSGLLAMNYQNFDHPIRRFFPGIKQSWNSSYNLSERSMQVLMEKSGFSIRSSRTEWQQTTLGHIARGAKLAIPRLMQGTQIRVYAISFNFVLVEKKPQL